MSKDFRAKQVRTNKIIGRSENALGGTGTKIQLALMKSGSADFAGGITGPTGGDSGNDVGRLKQIVDIAAGSTPHNNPNIGTDVWMVVDGNSSKKYERSAGESVLFLGDVVVSGTLYAERQRINISTYSITANSEDRAFITSGSIYVNERQGLSIGKTLVFPGDPGGDTFDEPRTGNGLTAADSVFWAGNNDGSNADDVGGSNSNPNPLLVIRPDDDVASAGDELGRVGIGTAAPDARFEIFGPIRTDGVVGTKRHLKISHTANDFFAIQVAADGKTTLSTEDADGAGGHIVLDADGQIDLDTHSGYLTFKKSTSDFGYVRFHEDSGLNDFQWYGYGDGSSANNAQLLFSFVDTKYGATTAKPTFRFHEDIKIEFRNANVYMHSHEADGIQMEATGNMLIGSTLANEKSLTLGNTASTHILLSPHGTAANEKILIKNAAGTAVDALKIETTAGGLDIDVGTQITLDAGTTLTATASTGDVNIVAEANNAKVRLRGDNESGIAIHLDGNAAAGSIVDIDAGILDIDAGASVSIDADGAGPISIGSEANTGAINVGTGASARTITIGNVTTTTGLVLNAGTGGVAINSTGTGDILINSDDIMELDSDGVLEINSSAGAISIGNDNVNQAINIGTDGDRTITIGEDGNTNTSVVIRSEAGMVLDAGTNAVTITGDLMVTGATTTINTANITVEDPLIELAKNQANNADALDIGFFGKYGVGGTHKYAGLFRDADDSGKFHLFKDTTVDLTSVTAIDRSGAGYAKADLVVNSVDVDDAGGITASSTINLTAPNIELGGDSAVLKFGAADNVTLTHVTDTGLQLNSTRQLQFGHADENISGDGTNLNIATGGDLLVNSPGELKLIKSTSTAGESSVINLVRVDAAVTPNDQLGAIHFTGREGSTDYTKVMITSKASSAFTGASTGAAELQFWTSAGATPAERMTIDHNGKVGIGVTDPDSQLEVFSTSTQQKWSYDSGDNPSFATMTVADDSHTILATGETGDFTIDAGGDITLDAQGADFSFSRAGNLGMKLTQHHHGGGDYDMLFKDKDSLEIFRIDSSENSLLMSSTRKLQFTDTKAWIQASASKTLEIQTGVGGGSPENGTINIGTGTGSTKTSTITIGESGVTTTTIHGLDLGGALSINSDTASLTFAGAGTDPVLSRDGSANFTISSAGGTMTFTDSGGTHTLTSLASGAVAAGTVFTTLGGDPSVGSDNHRNVTSSTRRIAIIGSGSVGGVHADEVYGFNGLSSPSDIVFFASGSIKPIGKNTPHPQSGVGEDHFYERRNVAFDSNLITSGSVFLRGLYNTNDDGEIIAGTGGSGDAQTFPHPVTSFNGSSVNGTGYVLSVDQTNMPGAASESSLFGMAALHGHLKFTYSHPDVRIPDYGLSFTAANGANDVMLVKPSESAVIIPASKKLAFADSANKYISTDGNDIEIASGRSIIVSLDKDENVSAPANEDNATFVINDGDGTEIFKVEEETGAVTAGSLSLTTDLAVAHGGTGASNEADARNNLGLGTISTQAANNVAITGGTIGGITSLDLNGDLDLTSHAIDIDLIDDNTSALSFDASGKAGILEIVTTNDSEKVKMSGDLDVLGGSTTFSSAAASEPVISITNNGALGTTTAASSMAFRRTGYTTGNPSTNAPIGKIDFISQSTAGGKPERTYASLTTSIKSPTNAQEQGKLTLSVQARGSATSNHKPGLVIEGGATADAVYVTLGNGANSTVSIPGSLSVTGGITGNASSATSATTATTATTATQVTVADESSDTTCFPLFVTTATGNLAPKSGDNLTFNSSTGLLTATSLGGTLTTAAQTNITSVGTLSGLSVLGNSSLVGNLEITDINSSSATRGGRCRLISDDGAAMASGHRLGVIEFAGAEDASNTITVGARIEALCDSAWSATENGADLLFYTTDGNASQSEQMRITADGKVGIGTATPDSALTIALNSNPSNNAGPPQHIHLHETADDYARMSFTNNVDTAGTLGNYSHEWTLAGRPATQTNEENAYFNVWYGDANGDGSGADILSLRGNKRVGVNTANPSSAFHVVGDFTAQGHILPHANNTYDLGSNTNRFRNIYTNDLNLCNEGRGNDVDGTSGNWTIQEGEDNLYVINNLTGKKYKMALTPVDDD